MNMYTSWSKLSCQLIFLSLTTLFTFQSGTTVSANPVNWIGPNNGEWDVASNWSDNAVPTSTDDVIDNLTNTSYVGDSATQTTVASSFKINSLANTGGGGIINEYSGSLNIVGNLTNTNSQITNIGDYDLIGGVSDVLSNIYLGGNLTNSNGTIESTDGAIFSMTGGSGSNSVINQNNSLIEAAGQSVDYQAGTIYLGDSNGYNYLSSIDNETNSTIEGYNGGNIDILSASTDNASGCTIEATGENVDGFSSIVNFNSVSAPDNPMPGNDITNNGTILAAKSGQINQEPSNGGSVTFTNGSTGTLEVTDLYSSITLNLSSPLVNTGDIMVLNQGTLNVNQDINQSAGLTKVNSNLILQTSTSSGSVLQNFNLNGGVLDGINGILTGNVIQNGGTFNPGEDPADFTISGNYDLSGGTLQVDIASLSSYDELLVNGSSDLSGGTLNLDFIDGFVPQNGETFDFLQSTGGITGNFADFTSNLSGGSYSFNNGILTIDGAPPVPESGSLPSMLLLLAPSRILALRKRRQITSY